MKNKHTMKITAVDQEESSDSLSLRIDLHVILSFNKYDVAPPDDPVLVATDKGELETVIEVDRALQEEPVKIFEDDWPLFSFFGGPITNVIPENNITLVEIYELITSTMYKNITEELRDISDKRMEDEFKKTRFDFVTFSGTFTKRKDAELITHSSRMVLDFDDIEDVELLKQKLLNDEYHETELLFTSPTGKGIKWIILIDLTKCSHLEYFNPVRNYIKITYGIDIDKSGSDVSRACFLPYDPNCYINPKYKL